MSRRRLLGVAGCHTYDPIIPDRLAKAAVCSLQSVLCGLRSLYVPGRMIVLSILSTGVGYTPSAIVVRAARAVTAITDAGT